MCPEASGQQKQSRGWRRPRMVPVVARGSRAPEAMAQNSQLACPFLRPAAQRAGRSLHPNPECPEGGGTPPPSRANSRLLQTACRVPRHMCWYVGGESRKKVPGQKVWAKVTERRWERQRSTTCNLLQRGMVPRELRNGLAEEYCLEIQISLPHCCLE